MLVTSGCGGDDRFVATAALACAAPDDRDPAPRKKRRWWRRG
jgi:hypothetical protein